MSEQEYQTEICSYCRQPLEPSGGHYLTRVDTGERLPVHIECHIDIREMADNVPESQWSDYFREWVKRENLTLAKTFGGWRVPGDY